MFLQGQTFFIIAIKSCPHGPCPKWHPQPFSPLWVYTLPLGPLGNSSLWSLPPVEPLQMKASGSYNGLKMGVLENSIDKWNTLWPWTSQRMWRKAGSGSKHLDEGHASYSGQNNLFKLEERLSGWLSKYSSLFRFSMPFRGCKYETGTGLSLGFPGPGTVYFYVAVLLIASKLSKIWYHRAHRLIHQPIHPQKCLYQPGTF